MQDDQAYLKACHSQNSLLKHCQGYLGIFRDIDAYSAILTDVQNQKKCPDFGKKALIVSIIGLNFPFKM